MSSSVRAKLKGYPMLDSTEFSSGQGKFHIGDTWTAHVVQGQLEFDEKKKFHAAVKQEVNNYH